MNPNLPLLRTMSQAIDFHPRAAFHVDLAGPADDAALRDLFRRTPMGKGIRIAFEREPSYFDAGTIQGEIHQTAVVRERRSGRIVACGTRIIREGYLNGKAGAVGYLGDLRVDPTWRRGTLVARLYRFLAEQHGEVCGWHYTVIFEGNIEARKTIATGRAGLPMYRDCGRILCPSLYLRKPLPEVMLPGVTVRKATESDWPEIVACLNRNLKNRLFGVVHAADPGDLRDAFLGLQRP